MQKVTLCDLRDNGEQVLDLVARGTTLVVTRDGAEVAELRPRRARGLPAAELLARWKHLPDLEPEAFRRDVGGADRSGVMTRQGLLDRHFTFRTQESCPTNRLSARSRFAELLVGPLVAQTDE